MRSMHEKLYPGDKLFEFVWRIKKDDGQPKTDRGYGRTPEDAFMRLGFSAGAIPALDYHRRVPKSEPE